MEGISALHGGHQDAQKFMKTTLPCSMDVLLILPFELVKEKEDIPGKLDTSKLDVLLTIGAGDIDSLVGPIEAILKKERRR